METVAIFYNVRSAHNVGSLFRTADGAGVAKIYLAGYTPTPIDRFGREDGAVHKTALGAEKVVPWEKKDIGEAIHTLKEDGYTIVGVEQAENAIDYRTYTPKEKTAYIFGNEVDGLPQEVLDLCDAVIEIPMRGEKESLNVSVTAGIVLFHYAR